jgi:hypothetical protein
VAFGRRVQSRFVIAIVVIFCVAFALAGTLAAVSFLGSRRFANRMALLDARLRPLEAVSGRCEACQGAGTRLEPQPVPASGAVMGRATCFRCGGTGLPPPVGDPGSFGSSLGLSAREILAFIRVKAAGSVADEDLTK